MSEPCIAAMDGGGTKTLLVIARQDSTIVEIRRGAGSNPFDQPLWRSVLENLLGNLPSSLEAVSFGLAGYGESETLRSRQDDVVNSLISVPFFIRNDVDMACTGAFAGKSGILLLSGTGSMAWGTDGHKRQCRVGGWGALFGDEGSAFWIGRKALSLLTEILDGRNTADANFLAPFCEGAGLPKNPELCGPALLEWYASLTHERSSVAALARIVSGMAESGNLTAQRLMTDAADELAAHIKAIRTRFADITMPWSYAGGTLQSPFLRNAIARQCGAPIKPILPPAGGGLLSAARLAGWNCEPEWIDRLAHNLHESGLSS